MVMEIGPQEQVSLGLCAVMIVALLLGYSDIVYVLLAILAGKYGIEASYRRYKLWKAKARKKR